MEKISKNVFISRRKVIEEYEKIIKKMNNDLNQKDRELQGLKNENRLIKELFTNEKIQQKNKSEDDMIPENIKKMIESGEFADIQKKFIRQIPWQHNNVPDIDMCFAEQILEKSHSGMREVKERFIKYIACQKHIGKNYGTVLLLVGPPGVGKTSISKTLAEAMGRKFAKISLAGEASALAIKGYDKNYSNPYPGKVIEAIIRAQSMCPLVLLDEIDKMGVSSEQGSAESALLDLLDSDRTNFVDNLINLPIDLSNVIFIATANATNTISPILLNRMKIIRLRGYTLEEKVDIAMNYLLPSLMIEYKLSKDEMEIDKKTLSYVIATYTNEPGIRTLEQILRELCESVIYNMQLQRDYSHDITISAFNSLMGYTKKPSKNKRENGECKQEKRILKKSDLYH